MKFASKRSNFKIPHQIYRNFSARHQAGLGPCPWQWRSGESDLSPNQRCRDFLIDDLRRRKTRPQNHEDFRSASTSKCRECEHLTNVRNLVKFQWWTVSSISSITDTNTIFFQSGPTPASFLFISFFSNSILHQNCMLQRDSNSEASMLTTWQPPQRPNKNIISILANRHHNLQQKYKSEGFELSSSRTLTKRPST